MIKKLVMTALQGIPLIHRGDPLNQIIALALERNGIILEDGDCLVIAQKVVSKSEGRLVSLTEVNPSSEALHFSEVVQKDPRFVELVLRESTRVVRAKPGLLITEHRLGFVCANAGIDHSNVAETDAMDETFLLLPEDPDLSARKMADSFLTQNGVRIGVCITDSHGRAWRNGTVGITIGLSGIPGIVDLRGEQDIFGYTLRATIIAAADSLAAGAALIMGETSEMTPVVHVRGFPYPFRDDVGLQELIRDPEQDLFR